MSERQEGWYWVKVDPEAWECGYWQGAAFGTWGVSGEFYRDDQLEEIGPRIPSPEEPWVTVPFEPTQVMVTAGVVKHRFCPAAHFVYAAMIAAAPKP